MNVNGRSTSKVSKTVLTVLVALLFGWSAIGKIVHLPMMVQGLTHAGIPANAIVPIGIMELTLLVLYLIPRTCAVGAILLTGHLGGAVVTNLIGHTDFFHPLIIGLLVWVGAYLRVAGLRTLLTRGVQWPDSRRIGSRAGIASTS